MHRSSIWTQIIPKRTFLAGVSQKLLGILRRTAPLVTCLFSPSRIRHHTNYIPVSGHPFTFTYSLSLFFNLLLTATVPSPSCHPSRLCLPSILLFIRIITKPFYQIFHTHLVPVLIFLGLVLQPLFSFRSVKLFFSFVFCHSLTFFFCFQKTMRPEMTVAASTPNVLVSYILPSI